MCCVLSILCLQKHGIGLVSHLFVIYLRSWIADLPLSDQLFTHFHASQWRQCNNTATTNFNISSTLKYPFSYSLNFIHSFILETYIAPLQDTTTQRRSQPSHGQRRSLEGVEKFGRGGLAYCLAVSAPL